MTSPTADAPAPPPAPDAPAPAGPAPDAAPARPAAHGVVAATAVIATIGVVVALIGLGLMLRTVSTPTQDCGTSLAFLLQGRVNVFVSVDDPPEGITSAEAEANNAEPCRDRVADQVKPAAVLFVAGLIAAVGAALTEVVIRSVGWLRRRKAARAADAQPLGP